MKIKLLAAAAVAALSLGASAVQAAPMTQLDDSVTSADATNIEAAGFKLHIYGGFGYPYYYRPYYYNYYNSCLYGRLVWNGWNYVCVYY